MISVSVSVDDDVVVDDAAIQPPLVVELLSLARRRRTLLLSLSSEKSMSFIIASLSFSVFPICQPVETGINQPKTTRLRDGQATQGCFSWRCVDDSLVEGARQ